ncbi:MAG TPA: MgtC/SapB family protein [Burkholderiales bacterium]|jgi:putative Mg2+ transporter-C (MgtC) family protein|nr:MgtC/SapB family protein [Burkholderiales bacterium]
MLTATLSNLDMILRLSLAALFGSLVGMERERLDWVAGLRTHMLVCVGACLFMLVSSYGFAEILGRPNVVLDPSRIAAQVVSGIGFIGAGTIIFRREAIRGLTTAASIWAVAAVGLAVGGGLLVTALGASVIIVVILGAVKPLERRLFRNRRRRLLNIQINSQTRLAAIEEAVHAAKVEYLQLSVERDASSDGYRVQLLLQPASESASLMLMDQLRQLEGVRQVDRAS